MNPPLHATLDPATGRVLLYSGPVQPRSFPVDASDLIPPPADQPVPAVPVPPRLTERAERTMLCRWMTLHGRPREIRPAWEGATGAVGV